MARTAHTARKEVQAPSKSAKEKSNDAVAKKTSKKLDDIIEKLDRTIEKTEKIEKKVAIGGGKTKSLSIKTPVISQGQKPVKTVSKKSKNILKEIKYYQSNIGFLIPKANVIRAVRSIILNLNKSVASSEFRFTSTSLTVIHEAIENHLVSLLELSYMAARHAKRVTLFASDIRLIHKIKRNL